MAGNCSLPAQAFIFNVWSLAARGEMGKMGRNDCDDNFDATLLPFLGYGITLIGKQIHLYDHKFNFHAQRCGKHTRTVNASFFITLTYDLSGENQMLPSNL